MASTNLKQCIDYMENLIDPLEPKATAADTNKLNLAEAVQRATFGKQVKPDMMNRQN